MFSDPIRMFKNTLGISSIGPYWNLKKHELF